ncbi:MAG: helix-turn-helix transcriptional regulator [bacterium]|nr:helix-turn-helix transcriptional regulator [bacterium]
MSVQKDNLEHLHKTVKVPVKEVREEYLVLGNRIRFIRKTLRYSQLEFAAKLEISNSYLSEIESGKATPNFPVLLRMVTHYNINLRYLFFEEGDMLSNALDKGAPDERQTVDDVNSLEDLLWLLEHSPAFKHNIMGYAAKYFFDNNEMIRKNIEHFKAKEKE